MKNIDLKALMVLVVCVLITVGMVQGVVQTVIPFADPLNEIGFTFMSLLGAIGAVMSLKK